MGLPYELWGTQDVNNVVGFSISTINFPCCKFHSYRITYFLNVELSCLYVKEGENVAIEVILLSGSNLYKSRALGATNSFNLLWP